MKINDVTNFGLEIRKSPNDVECMLGHNTRHSHWAVCFNFSSIDLPDGVSPVYPIAMCHTKADAETVYSCFKFVMEDGGWNIEELLPPGSDN